FPQVDKETRSVRILYILTHLVKVIFTSYARHNTCSHIPALVRGVADDIIFSISDGTSTPPQNIWFAVAYGMYCLLLICFSRLTQPLFKYIGASIVRLQGLYLTLSFFPSLICCSEQSLSAFNNWRISWLSRYATF
ncbi:MAG: hypothetical protein ACPGPF_05100, partial [Pontibacterium sp.]